MADPTTEDINGDGLVDVGDCKGEKGDQGEPGPSDHGLLLGLGDDDHPQYVMHNESNSVSAGMIQASAVTQDKLSASGAADGRVLKTNGVSMFWGTDEIGTAAGPWQQNGNGIWYNQSPVRAFIGMDPTQSGPYALRVNGSVRLGEHDNHDVDIYGIRVIHGGSNQQLEMTDCQDNFTVMEFECDGDIVIYRDGSSQKAIELRNLQSTIQAYNSGGQRTVWMRGDAPNNSGSLYLSNSDGTNKIILRGDDGSIEAVTYDFISDRT